MDLVANDWRVVEPIRGLPGQEDVGVGHGLDLGAVGGVGDVPEDDPDGGGGLPEGVTGDDLEKGTEVKALNHQKHTRKRPF